MQPLGQKASIVVLLLLGLGLALLYFFTIGVDPRRADLSACDDEIRSRLKAPSTYRRVAAPDDYSDSYYRFYSMTYEAENSLGVPLQSEGTCTLYGKGEDATATWSEDASLL